jgi:uncharacterized protein (DUF433 family)
MRMASSRLDRLRKTPAYPFAEAAHYLNLPRSTLRSWCIGYDYEVHGKTRRFQSLIRLDGEPREGLSFLNLVEAHVLTAIRRVHYIPLQCVREALTYVRKELHVERPLIDVSFQTNGVGLFVKVLSGVVDVTERGQLEMMSAGFEENLKRIRRDMDHVPTKLFPFTRTTGEDSMVVEMDPTIAFGRPVIRGSATPTAVLADRFKAGDSIEILAADLDIPSDLIQDAIRCELMRDAA